MKKSFSQVARAGKRRQGRRPASILINREVTPTTHVRRIRQCKAHKEH